MKKLTALFLSLILICSLFTACKKGPANAPIDGNTLSFTNLVEDMKALDGQQINITGYMSSAPSVDKSVFYLMNLPFSGSPFAKDNTIELADTIAVHTKSGNRADYTDSLITVTGTLTFRDCTDGNGKSYKYYIYDATYDTAQGDSLSKSEKMWQEFSSTGAAEETDKMFDYLYFLCCWAKTTYTIGEKTYYYTPEKALRSIELESGFYGYGFKEGYFDSIADKIASLNEGDYGALADNIEKAKALSQKAYNALKNGEYESVPEYSGSIGDGSNQYRLNNQEEIEKEYNSLYESYSSWLEGWKL